MTIEEVKQQTAEHTRLTQLRGRTASVIATASLPDGTVTYEVTVTHRKTGSGSETKATATVELNAASVLSIVTTEQSDLDTAIAVIEDAFDTI